jgi:hypothetical protein
MNAETIRVDEPNAPTPRSNAIDQLLRQPEALFARLDEPNAGRVLVKLALLALFGHVVYGVVVGSFAGGMQWWAAPLKMGLGMSLCAAICFPSLYIFVSSSGADARGMRVAGLMLGVLALTSVFLAGFAPVAWIFSQSSTLVSFIGPIHLLVWVLSMLASRRVLNAGLKHWQGRRNGLTGVWFFVLIITSLQMATTLRPIVGAGAQLFEPERKFFLQNWSETLTAELTEPPPSLRKK